MIFLTIQVRWPRTIRGDECLQRGMNVGNDEMRCLSVEIKEEEHGRDAQRYRGPFVALYKLHRVVNEKLRPADSEDLAESLLRTDVPTLAKREAVGPCATYLSFLVRGGST